MLERLRPLIGPEHTFSAVAAELRGLTRASGATAVGALHLTCTDESEYEGADAFRKDFAAETLPRLKFGQHVPFRLAIPGARYEFGSTGIAEEHFFTAAARRGWLLMVEKINTHVAVERAGAGGVAFGRMDRYGDASTYCGAIHALLAGSRLPSALALAAELRSDGVDRLAPLLDPACVARSHAPLLAAVALARLQARRIAQDVQDAPARGRVAHLVLHGVTLNRSGMDTELVCGAYLLDRRGTEPEDLYLGLGDDPRRYRLSEAGGTIRIDEGRDLELRPARDHRALSDAELARLRTRPVPSELEQAISRARAESSTVGPTARTLLAPLCGVLAEYTPVPAALFLFAEGLVGIHHAIRLRTHGSADEQTRAARNIVADFEAQLDRLSPADAKRIIERLADVCSPSR